MNDQSLEMMDDFDRWLIRICKALLILIFLVIFLTAIAWWIEPPPERRAAVQFTEAEKRWFNERFKYHGIWGCISENGEHYFYRDGKKCKL